MIESAGSRSLNPQSSGLKVIPSTAFDRHTGPFQESRSVHRRNPRVGSRPASQQPFATHYGPNGYERSGPISLSRDDQVVALRGGRSRRSMTRARSPRVTSCVGHSLHAASNATFASAILVDSNHETLASIIVTFAQHAQH